MSIFPEEQLDSAVGYFPGRLGQTLHNNRWTLMRKLGWGPRSSTWLASAEGAENIEAIKIYTIESSSDLRELRFLQGPAKDKFQNFPVLVNHFYEESPWGKHLCLVLQVLGSSVESLRLTNGGLGGYLATHVVKKVVSDVLESLCELHKKNIIHGAIKSDNLLFLANQDESDIREYISKSPNLPAEEVIDAQGTTHFVVKSQPFPPGIKWNEPRWSLANRSIYLSNFGHACFALSPYVSLDGPRHLLPPEVLFGGTPTAKADIWMLGTMVYLLLTGTELFQPSGDVSKQVIEKTLSELDRRLVSSHKVATQDLPATMAFLKACLNVNPSKRPTSDSLFGYEWVRGGNICSCGWCGTDPLL